MKLVSVASPLSTQH